MLASGSLDKSVKVWREGDGGGGQQINHHKWVRCLDWSVRGDLAVGCGGGEAAVWRGGSTRVDLKGHNSDILAIKFAKDGSLVATGSWDSTCRVWEATTGQLVRKVNCGSPVSALVWTGERSFVRGCSNGGIQQQWVDLGEDSRDFQWHCGDVQSLDFQPSSSLLASGSSDKMVIVQKVDNFISTPALLHTLTGHKDRVVEVKFSPSDAHFLSTCDESGEVRLWDVLNGNCRHIFQSGRLVGTQFEENLIDFSPDGKLLACRGGEVNVLRVASGQVAVVVIMI